MTLLRKKKQPTLSIYILKKRGTVSRKTSAKKNCCRLPAYQHIKLVTSYQFQ